MARTLNGLSPRAQQRRQSRIIDRAVLKYRGRIAKEIARAMRAMAAGEPHALREHERRIRRIMEPLWRDAVEQSADTNQAGRKQSFNEIEIKEVEVLQTINADKIARNFLSLYAARKITEITQTTQASVADIVADGINRGQTEKEIGARIRALIPIKSLSRAQTIARTESHQASQVAAASIAKASGINMMKQWAASEGDRTRDDHDDADGQTVGMDEPFIVGGELLMFPGDPAGSAKNVINCRCAVVYVLS